MSRRNWLGTVTMLGSLVLTGCAASDADTTDVPSSADRASQSTHTMPEGTVMDGSEHPDGHHGHEGGHSQPSPAAQMVCAGDVVEDVTRILALDDELEPAASWDEPMFTCRYDLDAGPLVVSVHDATDPGEGREHFDSLRGELGETEDLAGMVGFGLPAYETADGSVVFLRDGKTLHVDATALRADLGPDGTMSRNDVAYAVAAGVIACWTDHA